MAMAFPNKANTLPVTQHPVTSVPTRPHNNCAISHFNYTAWSDVDVVRSHAAVRIWHAASPRCSNSINQKRLPFAKIFTFAFTPTPRSPEHQTHSANVPFASTASQGYFISPYIWFNFFLFSNVRWKFLWSFICINLQIYIYIIFFSINFIKKKDINTILLKHIKSIMRIVNSII